MKSRKTSWRKEHLGCALKDLLYIWLKNSLKGMIVNKWRVAMFFFSQNNSNYVEKYMWYYKQRWVTSWDKNMTKDRPVSWTIHKRNGTGQWTSKTVFDLANNQNIPKGYLFLVYCCVAVIIFDNYMVLIVNDRASIMKNGTLELF